MNVGQSYSNSKNACFIKFIGGIHDGHSGLYDHDNYNEIGFSDAKAKMTWTYKRKSENLYELDSILNWSTGLVRLCDRD